MRFMARLHLIGMILAMMTAGLASAQDVARPIYPKLAELEERFQKQADELARKKLAALAELARTTPDAESEAVYRELFDLAVAQGHFSEAESAAREYLTHRQGPPESHALAASIILIARADRGEFDRSLADLTAFLKERASVDLPDDRKLPPALLMAVGEAYLQRLIEGGRIDIARKVCELGQTAFSDPGVRAHFKARADRLSMVGAAAPPIEGKDLDGKPVRLSDLQGKVVLVDFWASWCPPCVSSFPSLRELSNEFRDKGLAILGVNLDQLSRPAETRAAEPQTADLRWFLISQRAGWPNVVGQGAELAATAYGVSEIPARFLIGRDGKIIQVELRPHALRQAVARALAP